MGKAVAAVVNACRALLGAVFVFSGYVKAVDPLGTLYKLQDYAEAAGLAGVFPDWALTVGAVALSAAEFAIGVFLLLAMHRRAVSRVALALMAAMTAVTLWVAVANPVADCGCFGDAVKLTNWQTLGKNIVLTAAAAAVAARPGAMVRFLSRSNQWIAVNYTVLFILGTSAYCLYYLPVLDFRPYRIGAGIREGMEIPPGAPQPEFETTFVMEKDGVRREFTMDDYPDSTWTFVDSRTEQTAEGYVPPIQDFALATAGGEDITDSILDRKGCTLILAAPHIGTADDSNFGAIDQLCEYAAERGFPFYGATASGLAEIAKWRDLTGAEYPFLTADAVVLKTMVRSNPGLVLLKDGRVAGKWSHNGLPAPEEIDAVAQAPAPEPGTLWAKAAELAAVFALPLAALVLADRTWAWTRWLRNRKRDKKGKPTKTQQI